MAEIINLGPVGFNPTGDFDISRSYEKLDVVLYQGSSYVAKSDSIGQLPTNEEYWTRIVAGGIGVDDIVDNLESNDSEKPLSAKQGKVLTEIINDKEKKSVSKIIPSIITGDYYINVTYNNDSVDKKYLNISKNGYEWTKVCDLPSDAFISPASYDIDVKIINNEFIMIYDVLDKDYNGWRDLEYWAGGNRIAISRTSDFKHWEKYYLDIDLSYKQTFCPRFIEDSNKIYFTVSLSDLTEFYVETLSGNRGYKKDTYLCELNEGLTSIVETTQILESEKCTIDAQIYKNNNNYYLFVKNETDDIIYEYKSATLNSFSNLINQFKYNYSIVNTYTPLEGPYIIKIGDLFFLYADMHALLKTCVYISDDIETWYNHNLVYSDDRMVNFGVESINNNSKKELMLNLFKVTNYPEDRKPYDNAYNISNKNDYVTYESLTNFAKFYTLPNKKYIAYANNYTITPDNSLLSNGDTYTIIAKQGGSKTVTINSSAIHGETINTILSFNESVTFLCYSTNVCSIIEKYSPIKKVSGRIKFTDVNANTFASKTISVPGIGWGNCLSVVLTPLHGILDNTRKIYCVVASIEADVVTVAINPSINIGSQEIYYEITYNPIG